MTDPPTPMSPTRTNPPLNPTRQPTRPRQPPLPTSEPTPRPNTSGTNWFRAATPQNSSAPPLQPADCRAKATAPVLVVSCVGRKKRVGSSPVALGVRCERAITGLGEALSGIPNHVGHGVTPRGITGKDPVCRILGVEPGFLDHALDCHSIGLES